MQLDTNQVLRTGMAKQNFVAVPGLQSITGKAYVATVDKSLLKNQKPLTKTDRVVQYFLS